MRQRKKFDRGLTTLIMNLATLVTNMDDLKELAETMHLPRRTALLLVTTYKPVMVTMLQLYTSCSYHMLIVWYRSEMGDEFRKLYNLQKLFDVLRLGKKCADIMSCHSYGQVDTGICNMLRSRQLLKHDGMAASHLGDQDVTNEQYTSQGTSPSSLSHSSRENGESMANGEVSTSYSPRKVKIPKSISFKDSDLIDTENPDTEDHSTVAGLRVNVLEKDIDGTIWWVKVTHTESE